MAAGTVISSLTSPAGAQSVTTWAPVHPGDFADPGVMQYGGVYYAFATQNFASPSDTINIQTSTSTNGTTWSASSFDALPQLPSWATAGNTWAPSVAYDSADSEFVMYFTATKASDGDQCIGMATATSPQGPYVSASSSPVVCQDGYNSNPDYGGSIDPDIFTDNGQSTLLWKSDGNHVGIDAYIWSQPLSSNLQTLEGSPTAILADDQPWQGGIVEGPSMIDRNGVDYLFYSGNDEGSSSYAIGYAVCNQGPSAACTEGATNPILSSSSGMSGPGGPDLFENASGQVQMAFSAWDGTTIGYLNCGIRPMFMATISFTGQVPAVTPTTAPADTTTPSCGSAPVVGPGYWQVASDGGIFSFGSAHFYGSTGNLRLNAPIVGMAATPDRRGYWLVASDGGIFAFGDATFYGSMGNVRLNKPIVAMVPATDGRGYWLVASDGGIFAFGDAHFYGSTASQDLTSPIVAMAPGFLGGGYWLVDANGYVHPFGNTSDYGYLESAPGNFRITSMASTPDGQGYWLISANGNVEAFGDAVNYGSPYAGGVTGAVVGIATPGNGDGYWLQGSDGGIFSYGDAVFEGSMGGQRLNAPMVGIASATD